MKKILIVLAIASITTNANAQWFLGGSLGFNLTKSETEININDVITDHNAKTTNIGFAIASKFGYYFNEKFALGLSFSTGINLTSINPLNILIDPFGNTAYEYQSFSILWRINPLVRYSVFTHKRFSLILEGSIGAGKEELKQTYTCGDHKNVRRNSVIGIGVLNVTPILSFKLTDCLQLEAELNFLNLGYNIDITTVKEGAYKTKTTIHDFNIGFNSSSILVMSQFTIGAVYKFCPKKSKQKE